LLLFNNDEIVELSTGDLALIVSGAIFERKVEATEKRVKKGENKILQTSETASDEFLIDIYSRQDSTGYRILAKGFDFSCLEAEKEIVAAKNLKKLAKKLIEIASEVKFVEDYLQIRELLGNVWEVEERTDSQGLKRESFGKFHLENVTTINNLSQFTRYSRLQRQLL
jgi:NADH dehydrogenase/NADH:ubiquinone oxidoreductase subunit G